MLGGQTIINCGHTVSVAEAVPPVPPSFELIALVVLVKFPEIPGPVVVTLTARVQVPFAASDDAPDRLSAVSPGEGVNVPPHVLLAPVGLATCKPAGKLSLKLMPVSVVVGFGLLIVNVRLLVPLGGILVGLNALLNVGGATTVSVAVLLVVPVPPSVELIVPVVFT